jgi:hypothetical protein
MSSSTRPTATQLDDDSRSAIAALYDVALHTGNDAQLKAAAKMLTREMRLAQLPPEQVIIELKRAMPGVAQRQPGEIIGSQRQLHERVISACIAEYYRPTD